MDKLTSLKTHLIERVPGLKNNPEKLHIFADNGSIDGDFSANDNFQYNWQTVLICEGFSGHIDTLVLPLILWLKSNQRDLNATDIKFLLDPIDTKTADVRIEFPTSQSVHVSQDNDGNYTTEHKVETTPDWELIFGTLNTTTTDEDTFSG